MALVPNLEDRIGNTLPADNGAGTLLRNYLGILETHEIAANPVLRRSVESIFSISSLSPSAQPRQRRVLTPSRRKAAILHAIKQFIASNLGDHRLSSAMIADRHHLSTANSKDFLKRKDSLLRNRARPSHRTRVPAFEAIRVTTNGASVRLPTNAGSPTSRHSIGIFAAAMAAPHPT